jgi:hypothetical protein
MQEDREITDQEGTLRKWVNRDREGPIHTSPPASFYFRNLLNNPVCFSLQVLKMITTTEV